MSALCTVCEGIFEAAFKFLTNDDGQKRVQGEFWPLEKLEANNLPSSCRLCAILYHSKQRRCRRKWNDSSLEIPTETLNLFWRLSKSYQNDPRVADLRLYISDYEKSPHPHPQDRAHVQINVFHAPNSRFLNPFKGSRLNLHVSGTDVTTWPKVENISTWSPETVRLTRSWLSECFDNHPRCNEQSQKERLPMRLLDVDPHGRIRSLSEGAYDLTKCSVDAAPELRVCMTGSLPHNTAYLTLSHRWDGRPSVQLTFDSESLFKKAIPAELLHRPEAKTFRDAIQVVRCLGYRYLWIDALCINQEDDFEKAAEIGYMDRIYANGVANISATGAAHASDGLFFERDVLTVSPCYQRFHRSDHSAKDILDLVAYYDSSWNLYVNFEPINGRAWVYQERMLAPRVIHFTRQQTLWECFTVNASEGSPDGRLDSAGMYDYKTKIVIRNGLSRATIDEDAEARLWAMMIFHYSDLSLTYPGDRLLAVSALARHICKKRLLKPEDYLAGHWRPDFPANLVWAVTRWNTFAEKKPKFYYGRLTEEYIAPTWSWASVNSGVHDFVYKTLIPLATVIDVAVTTKYKDPFGQVTSGYLTLRCSLCQAFWHSVSRWMDLILSKGRVWRQRTFGNYHDFYFDEGSLFVSWDSDFFDTSLASKDRWIPLSDGQLHFSRDHFYLAPVTENPESKNIEGLILHRTSRRGQYVRVGSFTIAQKYATVHDGSYMSDHLGTDDDHSMEINKTVMRESDTFFAFWKAVLDNEVSLGTDDYLEATEDGKYVIEVV